MTVNEMMIKHNFITKVLLRDGDKELSKDLKVRLMSMRIELGKVRKQLEEDLQEAVKELTPKGYQELIMKENKTEEDKAQVEAWNKQINEEYNAYVDKRGKEEVQIDTTLSEDDFAQIIEVNAGNDVEINGTKLNAADFLEVLYSLFVA
ncbi:MAG: hypothetical protein [Bacteriophage sp.]|jgi:ribosome-associated toxin RatA of RatAB toxin-antitoxin module|nr:MAG: hypothetical protein [Bacteriophage sp.]UWG71410.1 MAG: hypothetical protein [Bacteriophage sp.]DAW70060.1 MAG TPA: hypothetical protein [Caudoviricetes sp.]